MPHLLVAGTTGSGKSVAVNGMITSVLYNATPEEVRFIMVDPKMLELSIYEGIPHLLLPVVTDPEEGEPGAALGGRGDGAPLRAARRRRACATSPGTTTDRGRRAAGRGGGSGRAAEPTRRCGVVIAGPDGTEQEVDLDADAEVTLPRAPTARTRRASSTYEAPSDEDLSDAAATVQAAKEKAERGRRKPTKLPYIVIVIDEFADLMMVAPQGGRDVSVARLAQKARAAGIHLILATQRPSVDVITGLIKANFPTRIAFQVASKIDSRTILDQHGAETLLGPGDMLFSDRGTKRAASTARSVATKEIQRVVDFLKPQGKPVYDMDILKPREEDAARTARRPTTSTTRCTTRRSPSSCETRQASISWIQRQLRIGYNRAARMVEQMEREGIVGPPTAPSRARCSRPRGNT